MISDLSTKRFFIEGDRLIEESLRTAGPGNWTPGRTWPLSTVEICKEDGKPWSKK